MEITSKHIVLGDVVTMPGVNDLQGAPISFLVTKFESFDSYNKPAPFTITEVKGWNDCEHVTLRVPHTLLTIVKDSELACVARQVKYRH